MQKALLNPTMACTVLFLRHILFRMELALDAEFINRPVGF
jgi:hypothetical protein